MQTMAVSSPRTFSVPALAGRSRSASSLSARAPTRRSVVSRTVWSKIDYVPASKVANLVTQEGYALLDVRDNNQFQKAHVKGSVHIPLFKEDEAKDPQSLINQQLHRGSVGANFGSSHTIRNDRFEELVEAQFGKDAKVILCCQQGLRSNTAAQDLAASGFSDLACVDGGFNSLTDELLGSLEVVGKEKISKAGFGGLMKSQQKISIVVGSVMFAAWAFLEFLPEQAAPLLAGLYGPNVVP